MFVHALIGLIVTLLKNILGISSPKKTFCFNKNNPIILIGGGGHFEYVDYFKQI